MTPGFKAAINDPSKTVWVFLQSRRIVKYRSAVKWEDVACWCVEGEARWHRVAALVRK